MISVVSMLRDGRQRREPLVAGCVGFAGAVLVAALYRRQAAVPAGSPELIH